MIRRAALAGTAALALVLAAEPVVTRHPYFEVDALPWFYAWYGFATCVAMVVAARLLGYVLKRPDDHYRE